jgi:putative SbcD/Mre11-related phosphoesterase
MDRSRYEVAPEIWLDARRALWLPQERTLAVADLHLGYAWAHRHSGQLMPLNRPDDTAERLVALQHDYQPRQIILLGDIVHRALPLSPIRDELVKVLDCAAPDCKVICVTGNHDRDIRTWLGDSLKSVTLTTSFSAGPCLFLHGDAESVGASAVEVDSARREKRWLVLGHEHPSATLSDGAATWQKYPCFAVGERVIVLPAFSGWAAGNSHDDYMSPLLDSVHIRQKIAILGEKLVPVRCD